MKRAAALAVVSLTCAPLATPQGRPVDWASFGGDARRSGFERSDIRITKDNVKDFQLVLKRKLEAPKGGAGLTPPVILGLLISYKGFKELGFVTSPAGNIWSIDVDTDRMFWQKKLAGGTGSGPCGGMTAHPTLTPPVTFGGGAARNRPATPGTAGPGTSPTPGLPPTDAGRNTNPPARVGASAGPGTSPTPGLPPTDAGRSTNPPARVGGTGFGAPRPVYVISSDGMLHMLNTSDGSEQFPPLPFLPANAKASPLAMHDHVMYTTTSGSCSGVPNAVWALDLAADDPKPVSFELKGGDVQGTAGLLVGNDGTVYVQTGAGASDPASNKLSNALVALAPRTLKMKGYFSTGDASAKSTSAVTPVAFDYKGKDIIATVTQDGRLALVSAQSLSGADHRTALHQTARLGSVYGGVSTWEDADGGRFLAAPVRGAVSSELKLTASGDAPKNGAVVVFKLEEQDGKPALTPAWVSRDLTAPVTPVVTSGVVFALSTGKGSERATLYALDAVTGKELYSTGNQVTAPATQTGLTVANGRVYFTTTDNTLYAFGVYMER